MCMYGVCIITVLLYSTCVCMEYVSLLYYCIVHVYVWIGVCIITVLLYSTCVCMEGVSLLYYCIVHVYVWSVYHYCITV